MIFRFLYFLLFSVLFAGASAQYYPVMKWQKFYGFKGNDEGKAIVKSSDGNLIIGGNITEEEANSTCTDLWILKLDTLGNIIWEQSIGGMGCDELRDLVATPDGGAIFTGISNSFIQHPEKGEESYQSDYFIGKMNFDGSIEWLKCYGGIDVDQSFCITRSGSDYLIAGESHSTNFDVETSLAMSNGWLIKIDGADGHKRSGWVYGGRKHDWVNAITACANGDFVLVGFTNSEDIDGTERRTNGDGWVVRIDRYGKVKWQRVYSGRFEDYFTGVSEDKEGRLILSGVFESEERARQYWYLKLTAEGSKIYEKIFGENMDEVSTSITTCADGGYMMTGFTRYNYLANKYIRGGEDFWLIRFDSKGNLLWQNTYGGRDDERAADIVEYKPGVFYSIGQKLNNFGGGGSVNKKNDFWVICVKEEQCEDIKIQTYTSTKGYTGYSKQSIKFKVVSSKGDSFLWDFGDGTTSREQDPVKIYDFPGVFEVKVTVFIGESCAKTSKLASLLMIW